MISQGKNDVKEILLSSTVSYGPPPRKMSERREGNYWYPNVMPLKLTPDFEESLKSTKKNCKEYASTYQTMGYHTLQILHNLPYNMVNLIYYYSSKTTSFGFSSVPGPPDGFCFHGMKSKGMYAFYPPISE